jgi:hypothetical protein
LALEAGVSTELVRHLLFGRQGRPISKITNECGARLLSLNCAAAKKLRDTFVLSKPTHNRIRQLRDQGMPADQLAAWCGLSRAEFAAMLAAGRCTRYVELMVKAACLLQPQSMGAARRAA